MPEVQMPLFDETEELTAEPPAEPSLREWSYSRRSLLEQCPRRYYYAYYGANSRTAKNEPQKEKLRFLKELQTRHLRTGNILHLVIRTYFKHQGKGEVWSVERARSWAQKLFRQDVAYSQSYQHGTPHLTGNQRPALLLEFYYGEGGTEALMAESEAQLMTAVTNFATSPTLARFREGGYQAEARVEKWVRKKEAHFTLRGTVDLTYRDGSHVVIVDWKLGSAGDSGDSLQLLSYAWWAMDEFKCSPDCITLQQVHLSDDSVSSSDVGQKDLMRVEARILQDLERMQEADKYGRRGLVEVFTPCAQPRICALCPFQEICPKE